MCSYNAKEQLCMKIFPGNNPVVNYIQFLQVIMTYVFPNHSIQERLYIYQFSIKLITTNLN